LELYSVEDIYKRYQ